MGSGGDGVPDDAVGFVGLAPVALAFRVALASLLHVHVLSARALIGHSVVWNFRHQGKKNGNHSTQQQLQYKSTTKEEQI